MFIQEIPPFRGRLDDGLSSPLPSKIHKKQRQKQKQKQKQRQRQGQMTQREQTPLFHQEDTIESTLNTKPQEQFLRDAQNTHQSFKDRDGCWLAGLLTQDGGGRGGKDGRYVLWSDVKRTLADISYLEDRGGRVLFEVDNEYKV